MGLLTLLTVLICSLPQTVLEKRLVLGAKVPAASLCGKTAEEPHLHPFHCREVGDYHNDQDEEQGKSVAL
jgi:hypothetical protein